MMAFEVLAICRVFIQFGLITCCYVNIISKGDVNENYAFLGSAGLVGVQF